ncbi:MULTISPECIES: hypothetical protein [Yersinia]|uniref:hypothetical protein n=1 Tax=Yersinia TaxID=629 RepID=UPI0011A15588|nr:MULTISPECIES: hypothetical protein [Yersinia]MBS0056920.1 hypothetical protein [Yersinia sp. Marseille-Q3913]
MKIDVRTLVFQDNGTKRIYTFTNDSVAIEYLSLPGKSRFNFFDRHGNTIYLNPQRIIMKRGIDRHKKQRGVKP